MYRKYKIDETFFDRIDTPNKAYFLGILYADGWNLSNKSIRIQLSGSDKEILEKLNKLIYYDDKPLYIRKARTLSICGKLTTAQEAYTLDICNKHINRTLTNYGMVTSKSQILKFPDCIPYELQSHFIRGYFDGDGSVSLTKNKQISINIIGSNIFCEQLQTILNVKEIKSTICKAGKSDKVKDLNIHGNIVGRKFLEFIYSDAELYLQRKYIKSKEILSIIPPELPITCSICDKPYYGCGYCKNHKYEFIGKKMRHERYLREKNSG